jgi:microsomal epoxide hydrolase
MMKEGFVVHIPERDLKDLRRRIAATRWPPITPGMGWDYGFDSEYLQKLARNWQSDYDWRAAEAHMNEFSHFRAVIDDIPVHFIFQPGKGSRPIPLILTHGFPWTFWDMRKVIRPLADPAAYGADPGDAFDLIVPSLPGFAFSTPLPRTGISSHVVADLWHRLMTEVLGYSRYAAAGADIGMRVTEQLGHKYASSLFGIHTTGIAAVDMYNRERYWDMSNLMVPYDTPEAVRRKQLPAAMRKFVPHVAVQSVEPQTFSYAMHDSPVGLLAWITQRRYLWGGIRNDDLETAFPIEHLLTTASLYWFTECFSSAVRIYADTARNPWKPEHTRQPRIEAPIGITMLAGENLPGTTTDQRIEMFRSSPQAEHYNIHLIRGHEAGGHFAHFENPQACIDDIRDTFRELRPK